MRKLIGAALVLLALASPVLARPTESFEAFVRGFEKTALAAGVTAETYRAATAGLTPDPNVPNLVSNQPEFTTPVWDYIEKRVSDRSIADGKNAMQANAALFADIGKRSGVDPYLLGAIWGIETDYGTILGNAKYIKPIIRSLFTVTHQRRTRFKEDAADLVAALLLVQRGPLSAQTLVGSWAGAIGHLQVNPSNVIAHGTDGDGDGRIDLHHSLADALATSAKFLLDLGYKPGMDWGFEVQLPGNFDYTLAGRESYQTVGFFADRGVTRVKGREFADRGLPVFLYVPAGKDGPKFLMTPNYLVLKGYNYSDSYAMAVAHMADRLKGGGDYVQAWPRKTKFPNLEQRKAIQQALIDLGLYQGSVDGRIGPVSQEAYERFQASRGEVADGFITLKTYEDLTAATQ
jgi:membrane-bound lytic murein transglycosylase B